ncbi:MAG: Uma2 family endonuclease [Verrucomicrobiaceae bacterium]|nr:Uma2 family endonuclease [Verrucomicrobiaceae bacterium]
MSAHAHTHEPPLLSRKDVMYPDSDGKPMSDNTLQFEWITTLHFGFQALYANDPNVFVASDLLWYPVEGQPKVRAAPDVLIAFGRPKGFRGSYKQWEEGGIAPQVVIEILSPGNKPMEMIEKHRFYERHGVEEYYLYDPDPGDESLAGYLRSGEHLMLLPDMQGWISPRTGVKLELSDGRLVCTRHDGKVFEPYLDVMVRAQDEAARAERLAAKLRALGIDPDAI